MDLVNIILNDITQNQITMHSMDSLIRIQEAHATLHRPRWLRGRTAEASECELHLEGGMEWYWKSDGRRFVDGQVEWAGSKENLGAVRGGEGEDDQMAKRMSGYMQNITGKVR